MRYDVQAYFILFMLRLISQSLQYVIGIHQQLNIKHIDVKVHVLQYSYSSKVRWQTCQHERHLTDGLKMVYLVKLSVTILWIEWNLYNAGQMEADGMLRWKRDWWISIICCKCWKYASPLFKVQNLTWQKLMMSAK